MPFPLLARDARIGRNRYEEAGTFFREIARNGVRIGAIAPTSGALTRQMVGAAGVRSALRIVELGAGTGAVTSEIVRVKPSGSRVLAMESNAEFAALLSRRFPRIHIRHDCAGMVASHARDLGLGAADGVLSSLPWACFDVRFRPGFSWP